MVHEAGSGGQGEMNSRWEEGIWLGIRERAHESLIGTPEGCIKVRSVKRKPDGSRWSGSLMKRLKGVPWEPILGRPDREIKSKVVIPGGDPVRVPGGKSGTSR